MMADIRLILFVIGGIFFLLILRFTYNGLFNIIVGTILALGVTEGNCINSVVLFNSSSFVFSILHSLAIRLTLQLFSNS